MPFDNQAFASWHVILVGAVCFAGLFTLLGMMSQLVTEGGFQVNRRVVAFGLAAFVGYIGIASLLRQDPPRKS